MAEGMRVALEFAEGSSGGGGKKLLRDSLSAVVCIDDELWLAGDETLTLDRLGRKGTKSGPAAYGDHRQFELADCLDLAAPPAPGSRKIEEADIEGLDYRDGYLWLVGSHSLKRARPDPEEPDRGTERLARVSTDGNRYLLARIPLEKDDDGFRPRRRIERDGRMLAAAARLQGGTAGSALTEALAADEHLGPFLRIPGKDNGFDIEGLAVAEDQRVFLGLRGPVLRGWAVVLELAPETDPRDPSMLRLGRLAGDAPHGVRKHFLDLGGLGVRDLCADGTDLLILAGPTMDLDGPVRVFRWREGLQTGAGGLVPGEALAKMLEVPFGEGVDHAEGICLLPADRGDEKRLLVVYDAPAKGRRIGGAGVAADLFPLRG